MASNRRVSASLADLRRIYRAGAKGQRVSLAAKVAGTPVRRKKRNKPVAKKKHARRSNKPKGVKRKKAMRAKKRRSR